MYLTIEIYVPYISLVKFYFIILSYFVPYLTHSFLAFIRRAGNTRRTFCNQMLLVAEIYFLFPQMTYNNETFVLEGETILFHVTSHTLIS